jgi:hypothetical protein
MNFNTTIPTNLGIVAGQYNLYIADQNPTTGNTNAINQLISIFTVTNQISISTLTPSPNPIQTYQSFTLTGKLSNWYSSLYPSSLYLYKTTPYDNVSTSTLTTIASDGAFTYTSSVSSLPGITIYLADISSYIQSNIATLNSVVGPVNAVLTNPTY